jgi:hypothetical protein
VSAHYLWQRLEIAAAGNEILTAIMEKTARRGKRNDDTLISLIIPKNLLLLMRGKSDCGRRESLSLSLVLLPSPPPLMMMMMEIEGKL